MPVIDWRAFSLTAVIMLLISLLWEATLGVPYGWWGFQDAQMIGIRITAWSGLPVEEVCCVAKWRELRDRCHRLPKSLRRWQSSGKRARHAFLRLMRRRGLARRQPLH